MEILVDQLAKGLISNLSKKQLWMNKQLYIHMRGNNTIEEKKQTIDLCNNLNESHRNNEMKEARL